VLGSQLEVLHHFQQLVRHRRAELDQLGYTDGNCLVQRLVFGAFRLNFAGLLFRFLFVHLLSFLPAVEQFNLIFDEFVLGITSEVHLVNVGF